MNPKWTRDELILALDLYMRVNPLHTSEQNPEIVALSETLNALPIHPQAAHGEQFRNPNGVYMKLCNFLRCDPDYEGSGLQRGNRLEQPIWDEFSGDPERLRATAAAIEASASLVGPPPPPAASQDEDEEFPEGRLLERLHKRRERNRTASRKKKKAVLEATGALECEVCDFDFFQTYGDVGHGFAECHHRVPLSDLPDNRTIRLSDLAIVCANCHRILHRARPWKTVEELRTAL